MEKNKNDTSALKTIVSVKELVHTCALTIAEI